MLKVTFYFFAESYNQKIEFFSPSRYSMRLKLWQIKGLMRATCTPNFSPTRATLPALWPLKAIQFRVATPLEATTLHGAICEHALSMMPDVNEFHKNKSYLWNSFGDAITLTEFKYRSTVSLSYSVPTTPVYFFEHTLQCECPFTSPVCSRHQL